MNCLEIFSGVGGMALGLETIGFSHLDIVDFDSSCIATLDLNIAKGILSSVHNKATLKDVRDYNFGAFEGKVDLLSGGPPCQPFSVGGSHRASKDERNMFPHAVRAVREVRPRAFIFENVFGLTRANFKPYCDYLTLTLSYPSISNTHFDTWEKHYEFLLSHRKSSDGENCEYIVSVQKMNAADFGVPQSRRRIFFIGFRSDVKRTWSPPRPTHSEAALVIAKNSGTYFEKHQIPAVQARTELQQSSLFAEELKSLEPWITVRDALHDLPNPEMRDSINSLSGHFYKSGAKIYKGHTGSILDNPSKTLKAGVNGVPGGENMLVKEDGSVRYFTIRECARLQTFPDNFEFHETWSKAMRQIGNAVPVKLASHIGRTIYKTLEN